MYQTVSELPSIDLDKIKPVGYENQNQLEFFNRTITSLRPIKDQLDRIYAVAIDTELPPQINGEVNNMILEFIGIVNDLEKHKEANQSDLEFLTLKDTLLKKINNQFIQSRVEPNPNNKFLFMYSAIMAFKRERQDQDALDLARLKSEFGAFIGEAKQHNESRLAEIKQIEARSINVLSEIQQKAASTVVSKYAQVFKNESKTYAKTARNWFIAGIAICLATLLLLLAFFHYPSLEVTERIVSPEKTYYLYDYSKLISKFLIVSILLFLISYAFKKFSVYKHLETINRHRQNALNSYLILSESIVGEDPTTRNSLMLQVAKSIYEHTPTGLIPTRDGDTQAPEILEITKFFANGKAN